MKIPFMLKFPNGEETHFIEKLWEMVINERIAGVFAFEKYWDIGRDFGINLNPQEFTPKLHTIRNQSDRFKVGMMVQPFVWTYKPYKRNPNPLIPAQFDFMPPLKIISKQTFEISYVRNNKYPELKEFLPIVVIDGSHFYNPLLNINKGMLRFAINDGFNSVEHFFQYFNKPVKNMEIRHFTDLRY